MSIQVHESHTGSGLLIAEQAVTGDAVADALRAYEPSLRLVPQTDGAQGGLRWCVFRYMGRERDAEFVCAWQTDGGEPLPLSMQLLEKVRMLDVRTRGGAPDPNRLNEQHLERAHRDSLWEKEGIAGDFAPYLDRGRVSVAMGEKRAGKRGMPRKYRGQK